MSGDIARPIVTLAEAQAFARVETGEEEAILAGLIRTASALCEAFLNQIVIARSVAAFVPATGNWERLPFTPVRSIDLIETVDANGIATALPSARYAIDVDFAGDGWVRITDVNAGERVRVTASAGMAGDENGVPEPIRQGVLRLVAHMFACRDDDGGEPPAAVTALWRPYRRMRLS